jgi:putative ABC transport system permease protein
MPAREEPLWRRYFRFFGPDVDADVDEEISFHLEMREKDFLARGLSPEGARKAAIRKFGDVERHRRQLRRQDGRRLRRNRWSERLDEWTQDLRFAFRMLWHHRGFSGAVIATLALGIGATTAIFSAVDAAMLRPLPFADSGRLVQLPDIQIPFAPEGKELPSTLPDIRTVGGFSIFFSGIAAYASGGLNLSGVGSPVRVQVGVVTAGFFSTLGLSPAQGRVFGPEEGRPGNDAVTVISHTLWQRQFGGGKAVGASVRLSGRLYQVIGVMPRGVTFPDGADLWIPLTVPMTFESFTPFRGFISSTVVARLAPSVSRDAARARLQQAWREIPPTFSDDAKEVIANPLRPLQDTLVGDRRTPMLVLLGATALLLLIACVNVTNLLLAHAATRERELAVRAVLGATRGRLVRQLLVQSLVLSLGGALAGLLCAYASLGVVGTLLPQGLAGLAAPALDGRVLGFAIVLAAITGLGFGLWPAVRGARADAQTAMKSAGGQSAGRARGRTRRMLVAAELALALMLLASAGLMLRSFRALLGIDAGFRTEHVATLQVAFEQGTRSALASRLHVVEGLLEKLQSTPGIEEAGIVNDLPLSGQGGIALQVEPEGRPADSTALRKFARYLKASGGYFRALNIPLLRGRLLTEADDSIAPKVAVISSTMARQYWPNQDPIGMRFRNGGAGNEGYRTVIGVVADVREHLDEDPQPQAYYPIHESPPLNLSLVARGTLPESGLLAALREAVRAVDPTQAVYNVRMLDEMQSISLAPRRSNTTLITTFGLLALLLAVVGVYGVVAYNVTLRNRELGIRAALGARRADLARLVIREGLGVALVGVSIGLAGAFALSRVLRALLYGVGPSDPASFIAAALVLLLPVLGATLIPARRAARANPVEVMRTE